MALLGNDGVQDVLPSRVDGFRRPIHLLSIVTLGLPLVDVMDLEAAAAECPCFADPIAPSRRASSSPSIAR